jgi:hypothetical protein
MKKNSLYLLILLILTPMACGQKTAYDDKTNKEEKSLVEPKSINPENAQSVIEAGDNITKGYFFLSDSLFYLRARMQEDHRIFGYEKPDIRSKPLILFSIFTNDVENNPYGCELGSYYDTDGTDGLTIKYQGAEGDFVEAFAIDSLKKKTRIFFEKKWIVIEKE